MPVTLSVPVKVTIVTAAVGFTLIGILAAYFRRKRRPKFLRNRSIDEDTQSLNSVDSSSKGRKRKSPVHGYIQRSRILPNGELMSSRRCESPSLQPNAGDTSVTGSASNLDDTCSISTITVIPKQDVAVLDPKQLAEIGMESLNQAIEYWESAMKKIENMEEDELDGPTEQLQYEIGELLEKAYRIQEMFANKHFSAYSTDLALNATLQELNREYEENKRRNMRSRSMRSLDDSSSDVESFVSALSYADLSDLEFQKGQFTQYAIYEAALMEIEHGCVPCRTLRTKMLCCGSDTEFLAKLHCVRLAFQELFKDESVRNYFADCGRQMISDLLVKAERDPEEFQQDFDSMLDWVKDQGNWPEMEEELRGRGLKLMTFYDIVIDFIILDAFDDLENPPTSVISVVQNRWLSNGFKETALSTAVWSVLKAKKRMLKFQKGFISHFYAVSEHTSPVMAWGFLGPDTALKALCMVFKDEVLGFMRDVFSFDKVRYTSIEHLADDILRLARERLMTLMTKMSLPQT